MEEEGDSRTEIYAVRTTIGQEKNTADMLASRAKNRDLLIKSILVPQDIRGYVFIEAGDRGSVEEARSGIKHARGIVERKVPFEEVENLLEPKSAISGIEIGDIVEISSSPFKGERARITKISESKEEATVELFEATVPIPVTVRGDHLRVIKKKEEEK